MNYIGAAVKISPKRTKPQIVVLVHSQGDSCVFFVAFLALYYSKY